MGVGALTMARAAAGRGYTLIGMSDANLFLVRTEDADNFADLDADLGRLMAAERFMYLATDYDGRVVPMGARPQWGLVWPPSETVFVPNQADLLEVDTFNANERWMAQISREIRGVHAKLDAYTRDPFPFLDIIPLPPEMYEPTPVESDDGQRETQAEGEAPAEG
jgi:hypothetical protein